MKNAMKRLLCTMLCMMMLLAAFSAAIAEETDPEPASDAGEAETLIEASKRDAETVDAARETLEGEEMAPAGAEVPKPESTRKSDVDLKTVESLQAGEAVSFTLNDNITAVLQDGVMTVSGEGETGWISNGNQVPWYGVRDQIREVVIEEGITEISKLFWDCTNLETVTFPEGLSSLYGTFCGCTALKSIELPASLTRIGEGTFADCSALSSVIAPNVETIEAYAFQGTAIKSYTLPKTLKELSTLAFWKGKIESFSLEDGHETYLEQDGVLFIDGGKTLYSYPAGRKTENVRIPDGVEKVGECAFASNAYMKSVDFNEATELKYSAFTSCTALETLEIPDTITKIDSCVFENCSGLKSIKFGNGLEKTGYRTFAGCKALTSIDFGSALHEIEGLCFAYCDGLRDVTLPETITKVGNGCFGECHGLESFTTTAVSIIPYQILLNDYRMNSLTLNDGVTEICRHAVYGTDSLKHVDVPASVQFVHDYGFDPRYTTVTVGNPELDPYGRSGWRKQEYVTVTGLYNYDKAFEMAEMVNKERAAAGLDPLKIDAEMTEYAMQRSMELAVMYSHTRPDGSAFYSPYMGSLWGENAAEYQVTAEEVMDAWMNSEGHRENILTSYYTRIGVGCVEVEGRCYWIQWFSKYDTDAFEKPTNKTVSKRIGYAIDTFNDAYQTSGVVFYFRQPPEYSYVFETDRTDYGMGVGGTTGIKFYLRGQNVSEKGRYLNARLPYPADELNWSVDDPSVASVENGVLTGRKNGKTKVTITTKNGYFTHKVSVTVGSLGAAEIKFADGAVEYKGTTPYVVADGKAKEPKVVVSGVDPSLYTVKYSNNVNAGTALVTVTMKSSGESRTLWFKIYLPATKTMTVVNNPYPLIQWDPVPGAKGYVIYRRAWNLKSSGWTTFERWNNTTDTYFYDRKAYAGTRYQYGVKAYFSEPMDNNNLGIVGPLKTIVYITPREMTSVTAGKGQLTVKWSESSVFTGYQVQLIENYYGSRDIMATVKITDPKTHEYTFKGLKEGKTYYVRVRSYQVFEGMTYFGQWSSVESCRLG
ncbi:MAG: leucine-rich repeat protein [Clostridia bacterium]|nr:leucine-rich repeat protein [Clostridia bacterium]